MRRAAVALFGCLCLIVIASAAAAQSRVALVIGNGAYTAAPPLSTSVADAGLVAETLRAAGYDVTQLADVRAADIGQAMRGFLDKVAAAGPDGVAFFYYAGHGAQSGGENYLVPVDAKIAGDEDVAYEAFRLGDLVAELAQLPAAARIVILDAAHDHGFGRGTPRPVPPGLAMMDVPEGMQVAFNAAPGAVAPPAEGANSLYTTALVTLMRQPGLDMEQIVKGARLEVNQASAGAQVPWTVSSLGVDLRLFEAAAATPVPDALPPVAAPPAGAPVGLVRVPPKGERTFNRDFLRGLSPDDAYQVVIEEDTLQGYQWFVELFPQHPFAGQVWDIINSRREAVLWRRTLAQNTRNAYWNYLKRYPDGAHAAEAQGRLEALSAPPAPPPTYVPVPEPLPPDYYDEAVGIADVVPQGFAPPPPVFDDTPPFFILPPPPRPPRPPIIIVRPPPPVVIIERGRRPPDIVVRPPRPPRPDGFRPGDGRRPPDGIRTPITTPVVTPPVGPRPTDGRMPRDGIRIQGGGPVVRPATPGSTPSPVRPATPVTAPVGPATTPSVVRPAPSGVMSTPSAQPVRPVTPGVGLPPGTRPTAPGVGLPPGGRPGQGPAPGQAVAPQGAPVVAPTPGSRPGMPMGPGGRPTIQGVTPGPRPGTPAGAPVQGSRPGLPQPPTAAPPPRPGMPPASGPTAVQPPRLPTSAPVTAQPPRPQPQPVRPVAQPPRPQPQPVRPVAQPPRPQPQPVRPVAQPPRPQPQPVRPVAQPPRPQPQPVRPVAQPPRPQPQPVRPVAQPPRPQPPRAAPPPPRPVAAPPRPAAPPPRAAPPPPRPAAAPSCPPGTRNVGGRCAR
jgi:uncharacterized caspase-like protein